MKNSYKKVTIFNRLCSIYNINDAKDALKEIDNLITIYKKKITSKNYHLSEKDIILITYGDQITAKGVKPLKSLKEFLDKYAKGIINSLHILPFYPYSSDDGFSVVDYKDVSPRMGSWEDIENLGENFRLMFDGVINHISQYSNWFKGFLNGDEKYKDFFIEINPNINLSNVIRPRTLPLLHDYKDSNGKIRYIWTTFSQDQVDLNFANYRVLIAILDVLLFYIQKGATLIRLDAIAFIWKEIGTKCVHLPQTHELIQLIREVLHKVAPEVIIITETNVPHQENISYFGSGDDEAQMVYNFALPPLLAHSILKNDASTLTKWAKTLRLPSDKVCFFNFTASHDGCGLRAVSGILTQEEIMNLVKTVKKRGGYVSYRTDEDGNESPYELNASYIDIVSDIEEEDLLRVKKMLLSQAVMLAMPGVAGIYFHSLIGATSYHEGVKKSGAYRSINREKFNFDILESEINKSGNIKTSIYRSYKQLLSIRVHEKAFNPYAKFQILNLHPSLFVIYRKCLDCVEGILAIHNFANCKIKIKLPDFIKSGDYDLINAKKIESNEIELEAYQILWLKISKGK